MRRLFLADFLQMWSCSSRFVFIFDACLKKFSSHNYFTGTWDDKVEITPVVGSSGSSENAIYQTGSVTLAWKRNMPAPDADKYYGFTLLAAQLNEPEEGVAPTDSRLRPDQRLMEDGRWDEANAEKVRLEEKQRAVRRRREAEAEKAAAEGNFLHD